MIWVLAVAIAWLWADFAIHRRWVWNMLDEDAPIRSILDNMIWAAQQYGLEDEWGPRSENLAHGIVAELVELKERVRELERERDEEAERWRA